MSLVTLEQVSLAFGHVALLDHVNFRLEAGERVAVIGRNGEGKSSLLQLISGDLSPDDGRIERRAVTLARLAQESELEGQQTVFHAVAAGLGHLGQLAEDYHTLTQRLAHQPNDEALLKQLEHIQQQLEAQGGWQLEQRVEIILSRLQLPATERLATLSGGWRRRVTLAQALVRAPEVLLLDEPTNHLDMTTIAWLEELLIHDFQGGLIFVTHDRHFLQRLATRIVELDRGQLTSYPGDYATYVRTKEATLAAQAQHAAQFDKVLAQEEQWIRQGIKARRHRNQGRVRALEQLRIQRAQRRERQGQINLNVAQGPLSGRLVIVAEQLSYAYQGKAIVHNFSTTILRGDKIGIIGNNGIGKTTLLKLLLKEMAPHAGRVDHGSQLHIAYFDQLRAQLEPNATVVDTVAQGREQISINGQHKHVMAYLQDFLFAPERARSPVKALSGGERNRLLLAKLFTQPANVLVLDEPTNDLDIESLELLETLLIDYQGTILLVTHDRSFLDNVVTSTLVFEQPGQVNEYVGGYQDWLRQRPQSLPVVAKSNAVKTAKAQPDKPKSRNKLTYNQQRELAQLPERIEALETELEQVHALVSQADFYRRDAEYINQTLTRLKTLETELHTSYTRWEQLESQTDS